MNSLVCLKISRAKKMPVVKCQIVNVFSGQPVEHRMEPGYPICQESDFINPSDLEQIMNDLGEDNHFNLYIDEPTDEYIASPPEFVDIDEMCDSTQEGRDNNILKIHMKNSMSPTCTFPCTENYPGPYEFQLMLDSSSSHRKSWVYSNSLNKVFIDMQKVLLVQFRFNSNVQGLRVRALPVYTMDDYMSLPVERCTLHSVSFDPQRLAHSETGRCFCSNYQWVGHVLQSDHNGAQYEFDSQSERHSVVIPLDPPPAGSESVIVSYQFTCKTSCLKGMQRRPIDLIFTLETPHGDVLGRQRLSVKICSCPKRDKEREEFDAEMGKSSISLASTTRGKRKLSAEERKLNSRAKKIKAEKMDIIPETAYEMSDKIQESCDLLKNVVDQLKSVVDQLGLFINNLNSILH